MISVKGIYDGKEIHLLETVKAKPNVHVIITFLDEGAKPTAATAESTTLGALAGSWEDERAVEEIVRDIYASRVSSREEVSL